VRGATTHAHGLCRIADAPTLVKHPGHQQGSTCARQSRMLMAVHPSSFPELRWRGNHSFPGPGRMNNLLRHHN
jgi:hypothetical protein